MSFKSPLNRFVRNHPYFLENCIKLKFSGCPRKVFHTVMYIAPSRGHELWSLFCRLNWFSGGLRLLFNVWSENAPLFERLMEIHSNPPILYYGFNIPSDLLCTKSPLRGSQQQERTMDYPTHQCTCTTCMYVRTCACASVCVCLCACIFVSVCMCG